MNADPIWRTIRYSIYDLDEEVYSALHNLNNGLDEIL